MEKIRKRKRGMKIFEKELKREIERKERYRQIDRKGKRMRERDSIN